MMRAGRLVKILLLLQGHGQLTAKDLANILEVSERTIYRDIEALNLWNVPIIAQAGHGGGFSLFEGYKIDPSVFTVEQVSSLSAGSIALRGLTDFIDEDSEIEIANAKLLSTLTDEEKKVARRQIEFIHFDHSRWYRHYAYKDTLRLMKYAVLHDRRIVITFFARTDKERATQLTTTVNVYGLVYKSDTWYLVGYSELEQKLRSWSVARITQVQMTGETFSRQPDFSLKAWWKEEIENFGKGNTRILLKIDKSALHRFERVTWKKDNRFFDKGDYVVVELMVDNYQWIIDLVLVNRGDVVVVEPDELREKVLTSAKRIDQFHNPNLGKEKLSEDSLIDFEIFSLLGDRID
jgi:predicted DNA-binding transcriptional regulator YafY